VPRGPLIPVAAGVAAFLLSWVAVLLVRTLALRRGLLDLPNERSSHVRPTPRLGGVGVLVAIVVADAGMSGAAGVTSREAVFVLVLATSVSLVSLLDDFRGLPPLVRLVVHLTTAALAVAWLGALELGGLQFGPPAAAGIAARGLTVLWIAGFINAFNFMDGTDGIAATQALIAASAWGVAGWWLGNEPLTLLAVAVAAASAGFLVHNWPPATIFMGDVGSALLGLLLATLPLLAGDQHLLTAVLPVWPFVFDTTFTLLRRAHRRENVLAAHRSHLYQRLTRCGWSHGRTALLYSLLALAGAFVAVPMAVGRLNSVGPALSVLAVGSVMLWMLVVSQEARYRGSARGAIPAGRSDDA
jgi:UDP-N-acetylmuramyl pentapeptide phosphotransferase/UDP-N-acetylglucosamine-1-phosphate transferase